MKKKEKVLLIIILFEVAISEVLICIQFDRLNKYNDKINKRIQKLEIDNRLYQYDIDSLHEYYNK